MPHRTRLSAAAIAIPALAAALLLGAPSDAAPTELAAPPSEHRGEGYTITTRADVLAVGEEGFITVHIRAGDGLKVNDQYPHKLKFRQVPEGIALPKVVHKAQGRFENTQLFTFRVPVTASAAGTFGVSGRLRFSICSAKRCLIKKQSITVALRAH